jgi:methionyl-tRNA synthetase
MSGSEGQPYYITTPIYYVNDDPHIGHVYTTLACDVLARFKRLDGYRVRFLTGTDDHGQKVEKSAMAAGMEPQAFTDRVSENFRRLSQAMGYSNDDFIRTTEPRHKRACQALWAKLKAAGEIYLGSYAGWYAVRDEAFYTETELTKQADGTRVASSGAPVEWVEEPSYFFRLSAWQDRLLAFYEEKPDFIVPDTRRNEVISFVKGGLKDLSVSRTTFQDFKAFWPADLHMVGKDILRFHAAYWPAFLMAAGVAPPKRVFAHGWWTSEGQKISKSLGNVIDPFEIAEKYGLDQVRYFLLREVPFGNDGDFSLGAVVGRINNDLANDFGNLAQRVLSMVAKNCGGRVPEPGELAVADEALLSLARGLAARLRETYEEQAFHRALEATWEVIGAANRYVDEQAPWALRKSDPARMATVLYVVMESVRYLAILSQPVMPETMSRLLDQLGQPDDLRSFATLDQPLVPGTELPAPQGVFPRFQDEAAVTS